MRKFTLLSFWTMVCALFCYTAQGQTIAQTEDFNGGSLPAGWAAGNVGGNDWLFGTNGGSNIDGSSFAYFDDDALGGGAPAETATLTSPAVDMSSYVSANLTFDYNFRALGSSALTVDVWDGAAWQNVLTVNSDDCGAWGCTYPSANIDVTNHLNAAFQVRYTYDDGGGAWAWYTGVDNHEISGLPQIVMSEDFNGGTLPAGWATGNVGGNDWQFGSNGGSNIDGSSFAYFDDDALGGGAPAETATLTSPAFDVTAYTSLQIDYDYNFRALGSSALTVDVWDGAAWQNVQTVNSDDCGAWGCTYPNSSIIVSAHINAAFQVRFTYDDGGGAWAWYTGVDNVIIQAGPSCADPSDLGVSGVTTSQASLNWTDNAGAAMWDVEHGAAGFTPTGSPTDNDVANPFVKTGLTADTDYEYYVRADCGASQSAWIGPFAYSTPCAAINTFPYSENFDGGALPTCWQLANPLNTDQWLFGTNGASNIDGTAMVYFDDDALGFAASPQQAQAFSPPFDVSGASAVFVAFDYNYRHTTNSSFAVDVWDGSAWQNILTETADNCGAWGCSYPSASIDITAHANANLQVRFTYADGGDFGWYAGFDNFELTTPTCSDPTAGTGAAASTTTATLAWTENNGASQWDLEIGAAGFTPTGTPTVSGTNTNPYTATGLTAGTAYEYYVRTVCGAGDTSGWHGPIAFSTVMLPPLDEDFTGTSGTGTPALWSNFSSTGEEWVFSTTNIGHSAPNGNGGSGDFAAFDDSTPVTTDGTLMTPFVDVSGLTTPRLAFFMWSDAEDNSGVGGTGPNNATLTVDVWDGAAWNNMLTNTGNTTGWQEFTFDLSGLTITGPIQARFVCDEDHDGGFDDDISLDDIRIEETPLCLEPSMMTSASITQTTVDIGWTENNTPAATSWVIEYGPAGFTPGTGTLVAASANPWTVTGLTAGTVYDAYVAADCGGGDTSTYAGPESFSTLFAPVTTFPWCENFDGLAQCEPGSVCAPDQTCAASPAAIGWMQMSGDDTDWEIDNGSTSSFQIGDDVTGGGMYFYNESSSPCNSNTASLISREYDLSGLADPGISVDFYTHMDNSDGGTFLLEIEVPSQSGNWSTIYSETAAATGNGWTQQSVVQANTGNTVRFRISSTTGAAGFSDLGFDEFCVSGVPCLPAAATSVLATSPAADCAAGFYVDVDITSLGSSTQLSIQDDTGTVMSGITMTGMHQFGPYSSSASVNITIVHDSSQCNLVLPAVAASGLGCGDSICTAFTIACGETVNGSTSTMNMVAVPGFSLGAEEPDCGGGGLRSPNAFYKFVGTGDDVTFSLCPSLFDTRIDVLCHTGGDCSTGTFVCAAGNDDACGTNGWRSEVTLNTAVGVDYYVMVHAFSTGGTGSYTLSATCASAALPPANDDCNNSGAACRTLGTAETLAVQTNGSCSSTTGDYTAAALEGFNPSCDPFGQIKGVWYHFNTGTHDRVEVDINLGTATDIALSLYDACGGTELSCDDNGGAIGTQVLTGLTPGQDYYILLWGNAGEAGTFDICISEVASVTPPNNDICNTTFLNWTEYQFRQNTLTCNTATSNTTYAFDSGDPAVGCVTGGESIWFEFEAPTCIDVANAAFDVTLSSDNTGTDFDTEIQVLESDDNTCTGVMTQIACNDDNTGGCLGGGPGSSSTLDLTGLLTPGNTYFIKVAGFTGGVTGNVELSLTVEPDPLTLTAGTNAETEVLVDFNGINHDHADLFYAPQGATGYSIAWDVTSATQLITNLQPGTTYEFWAGHSCDGVADVNHDQYYWTPVATITTAASTCTAPDPLQCLTTTANSIDFQWTSVGLATHYHIFYRPTGNAGYNVVWNVTGATSYTLQNLMSNTSYEIWVYAVCPGPVAFQSATLLCVTGAPGSKPEPVSTQDGLYSFTYQGVEYVDFEMSDLMPLMNFSGHSETRFEVVDGELKEFTMNGEEIEGEPKKSLDFDMYPNPNEDRASVNVSFFLENEQDVRIALYDMNGNLIEASDLGTAQYNVHHVISTEDLAGGIYNVSVQTGDTYATKKLVVIK